MLGGGRYFTHIHQINRWASVSHRGLSRLIVFRVSVLVGVVANGYSFDCVGNCDRKQAGLAPALCSHGAGFQWRLQVLGPLPGCSTQTHRCSHDSKESFPPLFFPMVAIDLSSRAGPRIISPLAIGGSVP